MLEVKNIKKSFGDRTVIENVSAVMKPGQCNLIIGTCSSRIVARFYMMGKALLT